MAASPLRPERTGLPSYVSPVLKTLDRIRQRQALRPEQLTERAEAVLAARFGAAPRPAEVAFAHGALGLLAGHTNYFNGFAVLMPLAHGAAVAVRAAPDGPTRLLFDGSDDVWTLGPPPPAGEDLPLWARLAEEVRRRLGPAEAPVEIAVVCTVPAGCTDAYLAAVAVALARALQAFWALSLDAPALRRKLHEAVQAALDGPFSLAYLIGAEGGRPGTFTLADTETGEHLDLDAPPADELGWGLVDVGLGSRLAPDHDAGRRAKAAKALATLQARGFDFLTSFRDLEHRDLERALDKLPRNLRPLVRHLVAENRRVQKLVVAVRKRDWQFLGALLLISHASLRTDWRRPDAELDLVVEQAEAMSLDGMHGATATGRGGCVLLVGQPFVVPLCFDRIQHAFAERFGRTPEMTLL